MTAQNFGEFLQLKRMEKKIALQKMVELLNVSAPYLSDIEKSHRNPPEMDKLEQISSILQISEQERAFMFDLAGKMRDTVAPDLLNYIMERKRKYVAAALCTARDLDADEADWMCFVQELRNRKG